MLQLLKTPPTQFHHELTCCHNCRGGEYEEAEQDKNWGAICCKGQGCIVGEYNKEVNEQKYEERGDGMCPGCGWEE